MARFRSVASFVQSMVVALLASAFALGVVQAKPRIIVLTDIGGDPDDQQSLVRLMAYSYQFDIEGLILQTSNWKRGNIDPNYIYSIVDAYGLVRDNLLKHNPDYPAVAYLKGLVKRGQPGYGMAQVGDGKSTDGSRLIIASVDKNDPRPVWIQLWGGGNTLAQAIWDVRKSRSPAELAAFLAKIRVYEVSCQDEAGAWASVEFNGHDGRKKDLFWIRASEASKSFGYEINGKFNYARGGNEEVVSPAWFKANVQTNHGPLGAKYPNIMYKPEGDTPAFTHVMTNGLSDPCQPSFGGWGGRFEWMQVTKLNYPKLYLNAAETYWVKEEGYSPFWQYNDDNHAKDHWEYNGKSYDNVYCTYFRWREEYQNDFQAHMDWCVKSYADANHNPVVVVNGNTTKDVLYVNAKAGEGLALDAAGSSDPDGDQLSYTWWVYPEPGTYSGSVTINNASSQAATVNVPSDAVDKTIHVILTVTDNGSPSLYGYRRVVITGKSDIATSANAGGAAAHAGPVPRAMSNAVLALHPSSAVQVPAGIRGFRAYTPAGRQVMQWTRKHGDDSQVRVTLPSHLQALPLVVRFEQLDVCR